MPPAMNHTDYDDATDNFKTAATENCWAIFMESGVGFSNQYSVWMTALKTAQAASPVDQKTINKLQFLVDKCVEIT
jgi:hypothetical protein